MKFKNQIELLKDMESLKGKQLFKEKLIKMDKKDIINLCLFIKDSHYFFHSLSDVLFLWKKCNCSQSEFELLYFLVYLDRTQKKSYSNMNELMRKLRNLKGELGFERFQKLKTGQKIITDGGSQDSVIYVLKKLISKKLVTKKPFRFFAEINDVQSFMASCSSLFGFEESVLTDEERQIKKVMDKSFDLFLLASI